MIRRVAQRCSTAAVAPVAAAASAAVRPRAQSLLACAAAAASAAPHRLRLRAFSTAAPSPSSSSSAPVTPALTPVQRIQSDLAHCREAVRLHDNDHYLCALNVPSPARAGVFILRAFNLEIANVASRHSVPTVGSASEQEVFGEAAKRHAASNLAAALRQNHMLTEKEEQQVRVGLMKLQWWRDGLETAMEKVDQLQLAPTTRATEQGDLTTTAHAQPVLNMLAIACKQYQLSSARLATIIEARERSLVEGQPADIAALLHYSESTSSALLHLTLECLSVRNSHADEAASHIGKATGIALMLRSIPYSASKQQVLIPKSVVIEHDLDLSTLLSGVNTRQLSDCVFELASLAKQHVRAARALTPSVPKEARQALVPAVLCDSFLDRLEKYQFNVFDPALGLLPTAPKASVDPKKEASVSGVSLSGSSQGFQPLWLRLQLLKHRWAGTY